MHWKDFLKERNCILMDKNVGCLIFEVRHFESVEYVIFLDRIYVNFCTVRWHQNS